jgi:CubicO group peptidase (beta-lactamase class C family)
MKKILIFLILSLLATNNLSAFEFEKRMQLFTKWLNINGYDQYLDKSKEPIGFELDRSVCKDEIITQEYTTLKKCVGADGKIIPNSDLKFKKFYPTNLNIKLNKKKFNLGYQSNPNRDTLIFYLWNYSYRPKFMGNDPNALIFHEVKPSKEPYEFKFNLIEDKFVKKQLKTKGILSYLYFQSNNVLIDEISPKERLGEFIKEDTKFISMSMNKSVTSYILGHAICGGYIESIDSKINDWPIIQNSLYHNQKLINFLNMSTGDQKFINEYKKNATGRPLADLTYEFENEDLDKTIKNYLQGTTPSKKKYNYNGFITQLIINYVQFKTGNDFKKLLDEIFRDKVKIKHSINFEKSSHLAPLSSGALHPMIKATRYDYLRIAKAIMDDYQNDTCVGKYLKEIHKRRVSKGDKVQEEPHFNRTKSYGGQFHMDYPGLKDKVIFGMGGYGGNAILIDIENSRIVVLNSLHYNNEKFKYSHKKLLIDPIKKGK